jgi:MFS family permease
VALDAYRSALALPRVRTTVLVMFLARLPMTAMGILVTLHVVTGLHRGYGEAGLVGTATTLASALAAPRAGRMIDRFGVRPVVAVCGLTSAAFWITMPYLPYPALVALALLAGAAGLPAQSLARQFLTALVPADQRRPVFALDMVLGEASFVVGPALGILVLTEVSSTVALTGMGVSLGLTALGLWALDLPTRAAAESDPRDAGRPPRSTWLRARLLGSLAMTVGSLFTLAGTEGAVIATMRSQGQTAWTGLVITAMSAASIAGGLLHGAVPRSLPQAALAPLLSALLVPVGLFDRPWWLLCFALIPMNLLCTPALTAGTEAVSRLTPARVRGEAMGLLGSANSLGIALGSPAVGFVIDRTSPAWGFAAAGLGGLVLTGFGVAGQWRAATVGEASPVASAQPADAGT